MKIITGFVCLRRCFRYQNKNLNVTMGYDCIVRIFKVVKYDDYIIISYIL